MRITIAPALLLALTIMDPVAVSAALFPIPQYEIKAEQEETQTQRQSSGNLKQVPNVPLRIGLSLDSPSNVLKPGEQLKILDGVLLTEHIFSAPNSQGSPAPAAPQKQEPQRFEVQNPVVRFFASIPELIQPKAEAAEPGIGSDEYIPQGGLVRLNQAERVVSDPQGAKALVEVANHLGLDPIEFVALMSWESGGTLNPNALGGDKEMYKGLIQFSPSNAKRYGMDGQVSIRQYAPAVMQYLLDNGFRPGEHRDIRYAYSAILAGEAPQKFWGRKDSNGTNVWNAERHFKSGPHYERAKAFLEASIKELPKEEQPPQVTPATIPTISF